LTMKNIAHAKHLKKLLMYLLLILIMLVFLSPLVWALVSSIKPEAEIASYPPKWIPDTFTLEHYRHMLTNFPFLKWTMNSLTIATSSTLVILILTSTAAYALGRMCFPGRKLIYGSIICMLLLPIQAYIIPLYLFVAQLGLRDTLASLVLVAGANVTGVYILTNFFRTIPKELEEAAFIDGCGHYRIFFQVVLPLSKASLASVGILSFIANWNSFLWPLLALRTDNWKPLSVGVATFVGSFFNNHGFQYGPSLAAACMSIVPTVIVYLLLQRNFIQGIAHTGIKG
jgi:multiple sugar transport system permease protein